MSPLISVSEEKRISVKRKSQGQQCRNQFKPVGRSHLQDDIVLYVDRDKTHMSTSPLSARNKQQPFNIAYLLNVIKRCNVGFSFCQNDFLLSEMFY